MKREKMKKHGCRIHADEIKHPALALSFCPWPTPAKRESANEAFWVEVNPKDVWTVIVSEGDEPTLNEHGMLELRRTIDGIKYQLSPNDVYSIAKLKLHGFFLKA